MIVLLLTTAAWAGLMAEQKETEKTQKRLSLTEEQMEEWKRPDRELLEADGLGEFETRLPVVYLNTHGQQIMKENKILGTVTLLNADGSSQSVLTVPNEQYRATVKYRGASSYNKFDKKQYRIKFYKKNSDSTKKVSLAGMGENSEWVLNGPYLDKTLMRNHLVYDLARECDGWAPDSRYVELFEDGVYQGVYLAVEPVTNGESRLRLSEFGLLSGETPYIVCRDRIGTEERELDSYGKMAGYTYNALYLEYPAAKNVTQRQLDYVEKDLEKFEKALYSDFFADEKVGYPAYIDVDNWVDYFILNEFAMNYDAGNLSTYVYKELGGKLQLAVWDFNNAFDNYQWYSLDGEKFYTIQNSWFDRLCQDRSFVEKVILRYRKLRESTLSQEHIDALIASYQDELGDAVERNFTVWEYSFQDNLLAGTVEGDHSRDIRSYEDAVSQLEDMIAKRLAYLDGNLEKLYDNCIDGAIRERETM